MDRKFPMDLLRKLPDDNPNIGARAAAGRKRGPIPYHGRVWRCYTDRAHESVRGASLLRLARVMLYGRG